MRTKTYTCGENKKEKEPEGLELKKIGVCASGEGSESGSNLERESERVCHSTLQTDKKVNLVWVVTCVPKSPIGGSVSLLALQRLDAAIVGTSFSPSTYALPVASCFYV
ncbi:hypothetical protein QQF64_017850 [Cirrhinus molitorella]|uniref:Uncharacterized protein n=1 Tax=Cirrhinus molitorella TaxID=172907 RepID=A0ABR3LJT8_9TELE